jgi:hypothetical protein
MEQIGSIFLSQLYLPSSVLFPWFENFGEASRAPGLGKGEKPWVLSLSWGEEESLPLIG